MRDSDATIVFSTKERLTGGTRLTFELANRLGKPVLHLSRDEADAAVACPVLELRAFVEVSGRFEHSTWPGHGASQEPEISARSYLRFSLPLRWRR